MEVIVVLGLGLYVIFTSPQPRSSGRPIVGNPRNIVYSGVWDSMAKVNLSLGTKVGDE